MEDFKNTKEGRAVAQKYSDILPLSRPEPPGMSANPTIHGNLVIHTFVCPQIKRYQRF